MTIDITTRNLLIGLCSHMAYMQGQLEALHQLDDPDDHYWFRESVALQQKVADHLAAMADGPAVPQCREPAAVTGQPSDEEIMGLMPQQMHEDLAYAARAMANEAGTDNRKAKGFMRIALNRHAVDLARAVLVRWGNPAPTPPADGEVVEVVGLFRRWAEAYPDSVIVDPCWLTRAAELLERQVPLPPADGEVAKSVAWLRQEFMRNQQIGNRTGALQSLRAAELLERQVVVPVAVSDALIKAECALSDIAEGEPMTDEGDPLKWAERRCADTLAIIRPTMMQHKIRTSEWPPVAATAKPLPEVDQMAWRPIDTAPRDGTEILASDYDAIEIVSRVGPRFGEWTNREGEAMYPAWWQPLPDHPSLPGQEVGE